MEIRFKVNQAEAFRRGVSVPKSIVRLEIDPGILDEKTRNLIADRMDGIDVCDGFYKDEEKRVAPMQRIEAGEYKPRHIEANLPTLEAFLEAINKDQARIEHERLTPEQREQASRDLKVLLEH